jgi:DNA repair exonuclease SbcCD nuclease subunit
MHLADVHLGYKQYGSEERFHDFARAFDAAVGAALENEVNFVVLSGDLFHKSAIDPATLLQTVSNLDRLKAADIPIVAITGNHDRARYRDPSRSSWLNYLSERGHLILLSPSYETDPLHFTAWNGSQGGFIDIDGVRLVGLPYLGSSLEKILKEIPAALAALEPAEYTLLMGHFGLEGEVPGMAGGVPLESLQPLYDQVDYLALGHLHKPYVRQEWIYNPGSLETCSMSERNWRGGVNIVRVDTSQDPKHRVEHFHIPPRPFYRWDFEVDTFPTPKALYAALESFLQNEKNKQPDEDRRPIVELNLEGVLAFDRAALDVGHLLVLLKEIVDPLLPRLRNNTRAAEFEVGVEDDHSRQQLERQVILDLVQSDSRYSEKVAFWADLIQEIKTLSLANHPADEIVETLRQRTADRD